MRHIKSEMIPPTSTDTDGVYNNAIYGSAGNCIHVSCYVVSDYGYKQLLELRRPFMIQ